MKLVLFGSMVALILALSACTGEQGPMGFAGPKGEPGVQGPVGPQGPAGFDGLTVDSNQLIAEFGTPAIDICTGSANESCYFSGGQRIVYSDGTVMVTGYFRKLTLNGTDTDEDHNTISFLIPSSETTAKAVLNSYVDRGVGNNRLFLVYERAPETLKLVYDSDGSFAVSSGDEVVGTLSLSDW